MTVLVGAHVVGGLVAVTGGVVAMLTRKGSRAHRRGGRTWLGGLAVLCATAPALAAPAWSRFWHLPVLGAVAAGCALVGYLAIRRRRIVAHIVGMGGSFVVALTAFYVDNGPKLPLWDQLPPTVFWFLPAGVGVPIIVRAVHRRTSGRLATLPVMRGRDG